MRLTRENIQNKKEKKRINKNKSNLEENLSIKYKLGNTYLQEKIKKFNKEKAANEPIIKNKVQCANIYKNNNKKIHYKHNSQIKTELDKNRIYAKNKTILNNNNINIGNNINIINNNHMHENPNNKYNTNDKKINNINDEIERGFGTDYGMANKSTKNIYNNNNNNNVNSLINQGNDDNRINSMKEEGGMIRKRKGKITSLERRNHRFNDEIVMSDGDLLEDEKINYLNKRNHIYSNPFKFNSPSLSNNINQYKQKYDIDNDFYLSKDNENMDMDDVGSGLYNNFYKVNLAKKSNDNVINQRNKINSIIGYNEDLNKYKYNNTNDIQSKTNNSFYTHKSPKYSSNYNKNRNLITNRDNSNDDYNYINYLNDINGREYKKNDNYRGLYHSMIADNELPKSPYSKYSNTNDNNYVDNDNSRHKSIRRSNNNIKIVKKNNNTSIQEYNLSVRDDNEDSDNIDIYQNEFASFNNGTNNNDYYNQFTKNLHSKVHKRLNFDSNINIENEKYSSGKKTKANHSMIKRPIIPNKENNIGNWKSSNNLMNTPNFSETGKTPKRANFINNLRVKPLNNKELYDNIYSNSMNNSNISNIDDNSQYKILVKKRPKNDIPMPVGSSKKKKSLSNSANKSGNKLNNNFEICKNEKLNFVNEKKEKNNNDAKNDENKFVFDNENDMINYIFNKFEEERKKKSYFNRKLRFTGFVLSKKYKGKNLYDIRIEDDIEKINQQLKDEQILINDKEVEFRYVNEEKENNNNNKELIDENHKLKLENQILKLDNQKLNKKDTVKNELIKKLDNEKQNIIEEINKMKKEIDELKELNNKLIEEKKNLNNIENKKLNFEIENTNLLNINSNNENENENTINKITINSINNNNCSIINDNGDNLNYFSNDMVNYINENTNNNEEEGSHNLASTYKDMLNLMTGSVEINENFNDLENKGKNIGSNEVTKSKKNMNKENKEN